MYVRADADAGPVTPGPGRTPGVAAETAVATDSRTVTDSIRFTEALPSGLESLFYPGLNAWPRRTVASVFHGRMQPPAVPPRDLA
jgi:hypothetical protein